MEVVRPPRTSQQPVCPCCESIAAEIARYDAHKNDTTTVMPCALHCYTACFQLDRYFVDVD
eukprot:17331-Heterococcus_DN1.PRE.5